MPYLSALEVELLIIKRYTNRHFTLLEPAHICVQQRILAYFGLMIDTDAGVLAAYATG